MCCSSPALTSKECLEMDSSCSLGTDYLSLLDVITSALRLFFLPLEFQAVVLCIFLINYLTQAAAAAVREASVAPNISQSPQSNHPL